MLVFGAYFFCDDFKARYYGLFFSHGFRVLKANSISNVFLPNFFGTEIKVFRSWFFCLF